jgi:hypothetical protein
MAFIVGETHLKSRISAALCALATQISDHAP